MADFLPPQPQAGGSTTSPTEPTEEGIHLTLNELIISLHRIQVRQAAATAFLMQWIHVEGPDSAFRDALSDALMNEVKPFINFAIVRDEVIERAGGVGDGQLKES